MKSHFLNLYQYEYWSNERIITQLSGLDQVPEKVQSIFSHILTAQITWLSRLRGEPSPIGVWDLIPAEKWLSELRANTQGFQQYIQDLREEDFKNTLAYQNTKGVSFETPIQDILSHVIVHSSYHRGQVITLVRSDLDEVLPGFDYIFFTRE